MKTPGGGGAGKERSQGGGGGTNWLTTPLRRECQGGMFYKAMTRPQRCKETPCERNKKRGGFKTTGTQLNPARTENKKKNTGGEKFQGARIAHAAAWGTDPKTNKKGGEITRGPQLQEEGDHYRERKGKGNKAKGNEQSPNATDYNAEEKESG